MHRFAQLKGFVQAALLWCREDSRRRLAGIVNDLGADPAVPAEGLMVMTVGFSKSGKASFIHRHRRLRAFFRIDTDEIHRHLNAAFSELQDGGLVMGRGYWIRQFLTRDIRKMLVWKAARAGKNILSDSSNLNQRERGQYLAIAKQRGYRTIIVHIQCTESVLLARLAAADDERQKAGLSPTWIRLYQEVQRPRFQRPEPEEASLVVDYFSDQPQPDLLF